MRRRLLVAKALVHNPEILVLDEPTAGVDVELRNQLWKYVKKLNSEQGTTILLTTHYLEEAEQLCDEIAIINNGKLIACDRKENLMKLLSTKQIVISTFSKIDNQIFSTFSELETKILEENKIVINYDPEKIAVEKILRCISEANLQI